MTLNQLKKNTHKNATVMMSSIDYCIKKYGGMKKCITTSGNVSKAKNSNAYRAAQRAGFKDFYVHAGSRIGRNRSAGFNLIIIEK